MPCYSPEASDKDKQAMEAARHIQYLYPKLGIDIPGAAKELPTGYDILGFGKKADVLVRDLCGTCREMTDEQIESIIYNARCRQARRLADWWEDHQEWDRERVTKGIWQ